MKKFQVDNKITLEVMKQPLSSGKELTLDAIRIKGFAAIKQKNSSLISCEGIIDTGALVTVIPMEIWDKLLILDDYGKTKITGITSKKECQVECLIAKIKLRFFDLKKRITPTFDSIAYLNLEESSIPLIFGFSRCLEYFRLEIDPLENNACLIGKN